MNHRPHQRARLPSRPLRRPIAGQPLQERRPPVRCSEHFPPRHLEIASAGEAKTLHRPIRRQRQQNESGIRAPTKSFPRFPASSKELTHNGHRRRDEPIMGSSTAWCPPPGLCGSENQTNRTPLSSVQRYSDGCKQTNSAGGPGARTAAASTGPLPSQCRWSTGAICTAPYAGENSVSSHCARQPNSSAIAIRNSTPGASRHRRSNRWTPRPVAVSRTSHPDFFHPAIHRQCVTGSASCWYPSCEAANRSTARPQCQRCNVLRGWCSQANRATRLGLAATVDLERAVRGGSAQPVAERHFRRIDAGTGIGQQRLRAGEKLHAQRVGVPVSTAPPAVRTGIDYQQCSFGRSRHRVVAAGGKGDRLRRCAWSVECGEPLRAFRAKQPPCFFRKVAADVLELRAVEQNRRQRQRIEQLGGMIARRIEQPSAVVVAESRCAAGLRNPVQRPVPCARRSRPAPLTAARCAPPVCVRAGKSRARRRDSRSIARNESHPRGPVRAPV